MIDFGGESNLWWFEWIIGRKLNFKVEHAVLIGSFRRAHDRCNPIEKIIAVLWAGASIRRRVLGEIFPFFLDSLLCRHFGCSKLASY